MSDRFTEIVSTQKIVDNRTGKEYDGMLDSELLSLINGLDKKMRDKLIENDDLRDVVRLMSDVIDGFIALEQLRYKGWM